MKKRFTRLTLVMASLMLLTTACLKDGLHDFDALRKPMHLTGTFNPTLGTPLGSASITIAEMLGMFREIDGHIVTDSNDFVTIIYDTTLSYHINLSGSKSSDTFVYRYPIAGSLNIDLFDNIKELPSPDNLQLKNLFLNLKANLKATMTSDALLMMQYYGVTLYYDSVSVSAIAKNGDTIKVALHDTIVEVSDIEHGADAILIDGDDITYIINSQPKQLNYAFRLNTRIDNIDSTVPLSLLMSDSIGIRSYDITSNIALDFPVSLYVDSLIYEANIDMPTIAALDFTIDTSQLVLEIANSLPIGLQAKVYVIDSFDQQIATLIPNLPIEPAVLGYNSLLGNYESTDSSVATTYITITNDVFHSLQHAAKLRFNIYAHSSTNTPTPTPKPIVTVKGKDALTIKAYAKLRPQLDIDIPLGGSDK